MRYMGAEGGGEVSAQESEIQAGGQAGDVWK